MEGATATEPQARRAGTMSHDGSGASRSRPTASRRAPGGDSSAGTIPTARSNTEDARKAQRAFLAGVAAAKWQRRVQQARVRRAFLAGDPNANRLRLQLTDSDRPPSRGSNARDSSRLFASSGTANGGGSGGMYLPYGASARTPAAAPVAGKLQGVAGLTVRTEASERGGSSSRAAGAEARVRGNGDAPITSAVEAAAAKWIATVRRARAKQADLDLMLKRDTDAAKGVVSEDSTAFTATAVVARWRKRVREARARAGAAGADPSLDAGAQVQQARLQPHGSTDDSTDSQAPGTTARPLGKAGTRRRRVPGTAAEAADDAYTLADAARAAVASLARDAANDLATVDEAMMEGVHAARLEVVRRRRSRLLSTVHDISDRQLGVYNAMLHSPQPHMLHKQESERRTPVCPCPAFRAPFLKITEHPWFDRVIIAIILLNCLCLAAVDPLDADNSSTRNQVLEVADLGFLILYSVEMVLKIFATGLVAGPDAYLRQGWNVIDGSLVVSGWFAYLPFVDDASLASIRIVRMLRPLRTVQSVPGLRLLVNSMIASIPQLRNVVLLCLFMFVFFGISGVQLFGSMDARCMVPASGAVPAFIPVDEQGALCDLDGGYRTCGPTPDGTPTVCMKSGESPNGDITSFEHIGVAFLTIFQCITLEGWVDVMYWTEETGMLVISTIYFVALVVVGAIFLMNLIVAVIVTTLSVENDVAWEDDMERMASQHVDDDDGFPPVAPRHRRSSLLVTQQLVKHRRASNHGARRGSSGDKGLAGNYVDTLHQHHPVVSTTSTAVHTALDSRTSSCLPDSRTSRVPTHIDIDQQLTNEEAKGSGDAGVMPQMPDGVLVDASEVPRHRSPSHASSTAHDLVSPASPPRLVGGVNFSFRLANSANPPVADEDTAAAVAAAAEAAAAPATAAPDATGLPESHAASGDVGSRSTPAISGSGSAEVHTPSRDASSDANGYNSDADANAGSFRRRLPTIPSDLTPALPATSSGLSPSFVQPPLAPLCAAPSGDQGAQCATAGAATAKVSPHTSEGSPAYSLNSGDTHNTAGHGDAPNAPCGASATAGKQRPVVVTVAPPVSAPSDKGGKLVAGRDCSAWRTWVRVKVVDSAVFQNTILVLIVLNTLVLALEYHGIPRDVENVLDIANYVLTAVFAVEMVLKHVADGVRGYWADYFNMFDGTVVVVSIAEIAIHLLGIMDESGGLTALRALRLLRVFKLARQWESFNEILAAMASSLVKIAPFSVLLLLFMFIYSLLGMQLFGGKLGSPPPRLNYDSLLWSFVTTFQILTGENWNEVMYTGIHNVGWGVSVTFFVSEVVIGTYVVLNMFLAILLDHFTEVSEQRDVAKMEALAAAGALEDLAVDTAGVTHVFGVRPQRPAPGTVSHSGDTVVALTHGAAGSAPSGLVGDEVAGDELSFDNVPASRVPLTSLAKNVAAKIHHTREAPRTMTSARTYLGESKWSTDSPVAGPRPAFSLATKNAELLATPKFPGATVPRIDEATTTQLTSALALAPQAPDDDLSPASGGLDTLTYEEAQAEAEAALSVAIQSQRVLAATKEKAAGDHAQRIAEYKARAKLNRRRRRRKVCGSRCGRFYRHPAYKHKAFNVVGGDSCGRHQVGEVVLHPVFDAVITVFIAVACVALAMDSHDASQELRDMLWTVNLVLTAVFGMEMVLKMFAFGLCRGRGTYLRDPWNALDFFIVMVSLLDIGLDGTLAFVKVLRFLRALRPLRAVRRLEGLRVVLHAVVKAFPAAMNVALVCLLLFFLYGIMGVNFFGGTFYRCTDPTRTCEPSLAGPTCTDDIACAGTWTPMGATEPVPREWVNPSYADGSGTFSFDNSLVALVTLFEVASLELWHEVMFEAVDAVGVGWAPSRDNTPVAVFFFIIFVVFGSMFMLNLFVSVVVDNFRKLKRQQASGSMFMTEAQQQWVEMKGLVSRMRPAPLTAPPASSAYIRTQAFRIVAHGMFDIVVMTLIVLNVVVMATQHAGQGPMWETLGVVGSYVFGVLFVLEMVIKHMALGVSQYWSSSWNTFDGVLVIVNVATVVARDVFGSSLGVDLTLFRVVRVFRIFRLVKTVPQLRLIFTTLMLSLPSMGNVGLLLLLQFFMYAVMGMSLFGGADSSEFLNEHANFQNFGRAFMLLVRMCTGESWNGIMHDVVTPGDVSSQVVAYLYFGSFVVLGQFMMINLFVAVILENFEREFASSSVSKVTSADLEFFADLWSSMPREGVLRRDARHLHVKHFKMFLFRLGIPLGFDPVIDTPSYRMEFIASLRVKVHSRGNGIHVLEYSNVLEQVVKRSLAGRHMPIDDLDPDTALLKSLERVGSDATGLSRQHGDDDESGADVSHASIDTRRLSQKVESMAYSQLAAAVVIQRAFRRKILRQILRRAALHRASRASQASQASHASNASNQLDAGAGAEAVAN